MSWETERLTEFQHGLGEKVRATMHVHLDHDNCLEVVVMHGQSDELRRAADKLLATRGVTHGGIEIIATSAPQAHDHDHGHEHAHEHEHGGHRHTHKAAPAPKPAAKPKAARPKR